VPLDEGGAGGDSDRGERPIAGTETNSYSTAGPLAERLQRERRRAVQAEGRLAEIELILRREVERSNGEGISASALRAMLESVQVRVASLEDEVRASERQLLDLASAQRNTRGDVSSDGDDLAFGLEQSRQELRAAVESRRVGLPELARQRVEFEVELDRLQSLLTYRDSVCDGLAEELEQGTRFAAEVTARLTDLSRGRVAPARRPATQDARVVTLRRTLESEQAQLRQATRALEAARAELKIAQRGVSEIDDRRSREIEELRQALKNVEAERDRLHQAIDAAGTTAANERKRLETALDRERVGRGQANEALRQLESRLSDLERHQAMSSDDREQELRSRLVDHERELHRTEAERVRLAERVSLLQAALSSKEAELRRVGAGTPDRRAKGKVVPLAPARAPVGAARPSAPAENPPETVDLIRQRESDLARLSERWRELQDAYRDAVAEFGEVRAKRDRLLQNLDKEAGAGADPSVDRPPVLAVRPPTAAPRAAANDGDTWIVQESFSPCRMLVHIDDDDQRGEALRQLGDGLGLRYVAGGHVEVAPGTDLLVAANLLSEGADALEALVELARDEPGVRAVLYGARAGAGEIFAVVDVFPPPLDPKACATYLLATHPRLRRVLTVGESLDAMSRLREILGQSRCSTAVAFDARQATDLISLVRPEYVLVDLALPDGAGLDLLVDLGRRTDPPIHLGATWSRPLTAGAVPAAMAARLGAVAFDPARLVAAVTAAVRSARPRTGSDL
jgi:CheY-like chemotaxis protein